MLRTCRSAVRRATDAPRSFILVKTLPAVTIHRCVAFATIRIAHVTKFRIEPSVGDKDGYFDGIKVWNAEAAADLRRPTASGSSINR